MTAVSAPPLAAPARRPVLPLLGPAFVAAVAYVDPGNFAANVTAGSRHGYLLVWVVIASNVIAMLVQYLSAKLGVATGLSLAALCRDRYPRPVGYALWVQAELVALATDLAEIIGGAIALRLLFGLPVLTGGLVTGAVALAMLRLRRRGRRPFEGAVIGLLGVILCGFVVNAVTAGLHPPQVLTGMVPRLEGQDSLSLAVAMLGATVMPHAIYLHGGLTSGDRRGSADPASAMRAQRLDVLLAMSVAGLMNLLLLVVAAAALSGRGIETIEGAHAGLAATLGALPALLFALALLASGFASSSVGTLAGQMVMEGFLRRRIPDAVRRLVTLVPPLVVLALGVDPTRALLLSQVVLSFGIPFALVPLLHLTARRRVMREFVNRRLTTVAGTACAALVITLNVALVWNLVGGGAT